MKALAIIVLLVASCHKASDSSAAAGSGSSSVPVERDATRAARATPPQNATASAVGAAPTGPSPATRAKQLIDAQVKALSSGEGGDAALVASFAKDAVALVPDARAVGIASGLREAIARMTPHTTLKSTTVVKLVAGGNDGAIWLSAILEMVELDAEPEQKPTTETKRVRITELATADASWKVVAMAATEATDPMPSKQPPDAIAGATDPGPLSALVTKPASLDKALSTDASVAAFGTDDKEAAFGPAAAHALLTKWASLKLSLEGKPREVHGKTWGYLQANVNWQKQGKPFPSRMSAMVIAVPAADGSWTVVGVHYAAQ